MDDPDRHTQVVSNFLSVDSPYDGKAVLLDVLRLYDALVELPLYDGHSQQLELRLGDLL